MSGDFLKTNDAQVSENDKQSEVNTVNAKQLADLIDKNVNEDKDFVEIVTVDKDNKPLRDQIKDKIKEFIGHWDHVPEFLKDNEFIHTGYRINFHTPKKVLKSLFMVHNESINIWSHLGGAILLIILCVVLCFSVSSIDTQNIKLYVQDEVKELFEPVYQRLPDFSEIEDGFSEKINQTREDLSELKEKTIASLEATLESIRLEIRKVQKNINPEAIGNLLTKLKDQLDSFSRRLSDLKDSVRQSLDIKKLEESSNDLKVELNELEGELIERIDTDGLDWIDIYKYVNPTYGAALSRNERPLSRWPILVFLVSAVFCLLCSGIFHLFYCMNFRANQILLRLDYAGINILITGTCFPILVYGFYCQPFFSRLYLSIIGVSSIVVFFVSLGDKIHSQPYRKVKSMMYAGLGIFAGLPILHLTYLSITMSENSDNLNFTSSLPYYLAMGFVYLGGLASYTAKCPERYHPGKYDICGHSHQILHVCVLLSVALTYFGAFDNYYTRMQTPCIA